jgi:hypothetical protein
VAFGILGIRKELVRSRIWKSRLKEMLQMQANAAVYVWRQEDEEFAARWKMALDIGADSLEDEAVRRARDGYDKPVYQGGQMVGTVREYSDTLMVFLLKGARPRKYRDNINLRAETVSLDKLIAKMSCDELKAYTETGELPKHLQLEAGASE